MTAVTNICRNRMTICRPRAAQGIKLTPRHYAYLKISEGCNHRLHLLHHPVLRGDLASRPIGEVMREAKPWWRRA